MTEGPVLYDVEDHVATITINRPEAYNSLDYDAYEQLSARFAEASADDDVRAVVFTGRGRGFCTGDDVRKLLGAGAAELARRLATGELELPGTAMRRSDRPIIGAINGPAVGYEGEVLRGFVRSRGSELLSTEDHQESVAAFLERREPRFRGR